MLLAALHAGGAGLVSQLPWPYAQGAPERRSTDVYVNVWTASAADKIRGDQVKGKGSMAASLKRLVVQIRLQNVRVVKSARCVHVVIPDGP
eukprot:scaffold1881_cov256-Pinguiococcus_pyrenoidosus.AAC.25